MATTATITYQEYKNAWKTGFNELPIFFAFNQQQFEAGLKKYWNKPGRCPKYENAGKYVCFIGAGGYCYKTDVPKIHSWLKRDKLKELMRDPTFAEDAFYYEMGNHEYHINDQGNWDVLSCFGNIDYHRGDWPEPYFKQLGFEQQTIDAFFRARSRFLNDARENDWY